jgi:peptidoglycan hydrolase-like protein with peptidoglycan-binding domain
MRGGVVALLCLLMAAPAAAQQLAQKTPAKAKQAAPKKAVPKQAAPKAAPKQIQPKQAQPAAPNPLTASWNAVPLAERVSIQSDLIIVGDYNGAVSGIFDDASIAAVKAFQKRKGNQETGVLNPKERAQLAADAKPKQQQRGWQVVDDTAAGVRLMVPSKMMPQVSQIAGGSRWASARGEMAAETFRAMQAGATLASVFEQMKKQPAGRRVSDSSIQGDRFEINGLQNLKLFHVRGYARGDEIRGITILYDQANDGIMAPVVTAMTSAFVPFPTGIAQPPPKTKVEYLSGIAVSNEGHIVTDRDALEGCHVLSIAGIGGVDRIAEDRDGGIALLRVYGARDLKAAALAGETTKNPDVTLLGIADPQQQGGGREVTSARVRLTDTRAIEPTPGTGFTGAPVLDADGKVTGLVSLKAAVVAATAPAAPQAVLTPVETIRNLLDAQNVAPVAGAATGDAAKASVVRVICVRK